MNAIEKQFSSVSGTYATGLDYLRRTLEVYEALKEETEPVRPKELADHMGIIYYQNVVHPLHWLEEMGMIEREKHEEVVTLWCGSGGHYEEVTKVIDGLTYTARKWVNEESFKKVVEYYKWFVI